jgi:hypothetical protein
MMMASYRTAATDEPSDLEIPSGREVQFGHRDAPFGTVTGGWPLTVLKRTGFLLAVVDGRACANNINVSRSLLVETVALDGIREDLTRPEFIAEFERETTPGGPR